MEISKEIIELSREMNHQNNRSTSYPLFIVVADEKRYGDPSWCDNKERPEEIEIDDLCESCAKLCEDDEDLPEDCDECDSDAFHHYTVEKHVPQMNHGVFLTGKACDEYIKRRSYKMLPNAISYGISSYYSNDMKLAIQFLSSITTEDEKPAHNYQ